MKLVGRSFKYHRPRGILTAGSEEPNALVELRTGARREPNTRATTAELYDGLIAASQNRWPSLAFDIGAVNDLLSRFLVAGFYYKTFMWPAKFWEALYEPLIRRAAGLGRAAGAEDPDHYEKAFAHCDVLVIGGGPAGLMAALAAGRAGARVILCRRGFSPRRAAARRSATRSTASRAPNGPRASRPSSPSMPDVRIMRRTAVTGVFDHGQYGAVERVNDHVAVPPGARAAPARLEDRGEARGAGGGRARAADCVRQQRPPRRDAGRRGAQLYQPLRRGAGAAHRGFHQQ